MRVIDASGDYTGAAPWVFIHLLATALVSLLGMHRLRYHMVNDLGRFGKFPEATIRLLQADESLRDRMDTLKRGGRRV